MPGAAHETLVALLRARPTLLHEALRALGRPPVATGVVARDSALRVANPLEVRPDVVLLDGDACGPWVVVDVQRDEDPTKQRRWLAAAGVLLDTRGQMGDVVVVTHDAAVARWAERVARAEGPGGTELWLRPVVVRLTLAEVDTLLAANSADLAVLAAWAVHDQRGKRARSVVRAAIDTIGRAADPSLRRELMRAMISMFGDALARMVKEMFVDPLPIPDSPVYREIVEILEARGALRAEARTLLRVIARRGIDVDAAARARVESCTDIAQLDRWVDNAATATTLDEVFAAASDAE